MRSFFALRSNPSSFDLSSAIIRWFSLSFSSSMTILLSSDCNKFLRRCLQSLAAKRFFSALAFSSASICSFDIVCNCRCRPRPRAGRWSRGNSPVSSKATTGSVDCCFFKIPLLNTCFPLVPGILPALRSASTGVDFPDETADFFAATVAAVLPDRLVARLALRFVPVEAGAVGTTAGTTAASLGVVPRETFTDCVMDCSLYLTDGPVPLFSSSLLRNCNSSSESPVDVCHGEVGVIGIIRPSSFVDSSAAMRASLADGGGLDGQLNPLVEIRSDVAAADVAAADNCMGGGLCLPGFATDPDDLAIDSSSSKMSAEETGGVRDMSGTIW